MPIQTIIQRETFIGAGQSNMSGRGILSEVPSYSNITRIKIYSNAGAWVGGYEPTDDPTGQIDLVSRDPAPGASPLMPFANSLASLRTGRDIGIVPCALGGSTIDQWARNLSRSTLYGSMIARAKEAERDSELKGFIFYQGENDANTLTNANSWVSKCQTLIANIRSDLSLPNLAVIVTALGPDPGDPNFPYHTTLRNNQLAMTGANLSVVTAADLTGKSGDIIHLTTGSQQTLGQRYATAMNSLLT